jgi:hypothetical protein
MDPHESPLALVPIPAANHAGWMAILERDHPIFQKFVKVDEGRQTHGAVLSSALKK